MTHWHGSGSFLIETMTNTRCSRALSYNIVLVCRLNTWHPRLLDVHIKPTGQYGCIGVTFYRLLGHKAEMVAVAFVFLCHVCSMGTIPQSTIPRQSSQNCNMKKQEHCHDGSHSLPCLFDRKPESAAAVWLFASAKCFLLFMQPVLECSFASYISDLYREWKKRGLHVQDQTLLAVSPLHLSWPVMVWSGCEYCTLLWKPGPFSVQYRIYMFGVKAMSWSVDTNPLVVLRLLYSSKDKQRKDTDLGVI